MCPNNKMYVDTEVTIKGTNPIEPQQSSSSWEKTLLYLHAHPDTVIMNLIQSAGHEAVSMPKDIYPLQ